MSPRRSSRDLIVHTLPSITSVSPTLLPGSATRVYPPSGCTTFLIFGWSLTFLLRLPVVVLGRFGLICAWFCTVCLDKKTQNRRSDAPPSVSSAIFFLCARTSLRL